MNVFSIAWDSIWHHRTRSFLTALGIIIGVFAVVTLTSLGRGVQTFVNQKFATIGANVLTITPALPSSRAHQHQRGRPGGPGGGAAFVNVPSTLTAGDVSALNHGGHAALKAAGVITVPELLSKGATASSAGVMGVSRTYFRIENLKVSMGHLDGSGLVLGSSAAKSLFGKQAVIGQTLKVGTKSFTVTGVLAPAAGGPGFHPNHTAFLPLNAALKLTQQKYVSEIIVAASSAGTVPQAQSTANRILGKRHPSHNYRIITAQEILKTVTSTTSVITDFLAGIAGISLLVGGIGIMNIMLVTVSERFREIGIRKALGARDGDILIQFLSESVLLAVIGGIIGTALSGIATHVVGKAVGIPAGLTVSSVVTAVVFSIGVGAVFGVLPAMRAARLMPAEALRTE